MAEVTIIPSAQPVTSGKRPVFKNEGRFVQTVKQPSGPNPYARDPKNRLAYAPDPPRE